MQAPATQVKPVHNVIATEFYRFCIHINSMGELVTCKQLAILSELLLNKRRLSTVDNDVKR